MLNVGIVLFFYKSHFNSKLGWIGHLGTTCFTNTLNRYTDAILLLSSSFGLSVAYGLWHCSSLNITSMFDILPFQVFVFWVFSLKCPNFGIDWMVLSLWTNLIFLSCGRSKICKGYSLNNPILLINYMPNPVDYNLFTPSEILNPF